MTSKKVMTNMCDGKKLWTVCFVDVEGRGRRRGFATRAEAAAFGFDLIPEEIRSKSGIEIRKTNEGDEGDEGEESPQQMGWVGQDGRP